MKQKEIVMLFDQEDARKFDQRKMALLEADKNLAVVLRDFIDEHVRISDNPDWEDPTFAVLLVADVVVKHVFDQQGATALRNVITAAAEYLEGELVQ